MSAKKDWDQWAIALKPQLQQKTDRVEHHITEVDIVVAPPPDTDTKPDKGRIHFHPQYQLWMQKQGIRCANDVLKLQGEIVSGHADRHVVRIELTAGTRSRVVYLKREHVVGYRARWRNRQAGFGFVSRCEREAKMLQQLEARNVPAPQWLAYGNDEQGRAFLLVDELYGCVDLRVLLRDNVLSLEDRHQVITHLARTIARLHRHGFSTPDLCAKHLLISLQTYTATLIDWQSAPANCDVDIKQTIDSLANMHASLADELSTPFERIRFFIQYMRERQRDSSTNEKHHRKTMLKKILQAGEIAKRRTSIQLQRILNITEKPQRLVWLAEEAVVVIPELVESWPTPAIASPYYPANPEQERLDLPNGMIGELHRFATSSPIGRLTSALRERPWRSPAAHAARILFHLEQHNIPAPRLLAFGQRCISKFREESFLLAQPISGIPIQHYSPRTVTQRRQVIKCCAKILKQLHDIGCRPCKKQSNRDRAFVVDESISEIKIGSALAIKRCKGITFSQIHSDIEWLCHQLKIQYRTEKLCINKVYFGKKYDQYETGMNAE